MLIPLSPHLINKQWHNFTHQHVHQACQVQLKAKGNNEL